MQYLLFDKDGYPLNLTKEPGKTYLSGNMFGSTSVGYPFTQQIFIITDSGESVKCTVSLSGGPFKSFDRNNELIVENITSFNGQINLYAESSEPGTQSTILTIRDSSNARIAEITLECDFYEEEERFAALINNLYNPKLTPDTDIFYGFRNSDVKEANIDYRILNDKRKELLMIGHEIFPFVGADKALINMVHYLGYADADIKEVWKRIGNDNKPKLRYIQNKYQAHKRGERVEPFESTDEWEKTNKFGIFYKFNKPTGEYGDDNLPIVDNVFEYSNEEVLLKFKKVRDYLNKKFLPLNVKLHSITGEGFFFERIKINTFNENTTITDVSVKLNPGIKIHSDKYLFLEDLRKYDDRFYIDVVVDKTQPLDRYKKIPIALTDFRVKETVFNRRTGTPVGAVVDLEIGNLFDTVDKLKVNFNQVQSSLPFATWNTIQFGDNYECEWILTNTETGYKYRHRGFIQDTYQHRAIIPYVGTYNVELITWDLDNNTSYTRIENAIEVHMNQPLVTAFTLGRESVETFNELPNVKLDLVYGQLKKLYTKPNRVKDLRLRFDSLYPTKYLHNEKYDVHSAGIQKINSDRSLVLDVDSTRLSNTKIIAVPKQDINIREISVNRSNVISDSIAASALQSVLYQTVGLYKKTAVTYTQISSSIYNFSIGDLNSTYVVNGQYFELVSRDDTLCTVPSEVVEHLNGTNNLFIIEYITPVMITGITGTQCEFDSQWQDFTEETDVFFDVTTPKVPLEIHTFSFNRTTRTLYIDNPYRYFQLSINMVLRWSEFDNIIDVTQKSAFSLDSFDYQVSNPSFVLNSISNDYSDGFIKINGEAYDLPETIEEVIPFLETLIPFTFVEDPINGYIIANRKYHNDYDTYTIQSYGNLTVGNTPNTNTFEVVSQYKPRYDISFNELDVFNNTKTVQRDRQVFFTIDETKIPGINESTISILKNDVVFQTTRTNFTYIFTEPGYFQIQLNVVDNNGNTSTIKERLIYVE